jgi:hypothetical protein
VIYYREHKTVVIIVCMIVGIKASAFH